MSEVARIKAGKLQRETKAPSTIMKEITKGGTATDTNFVGASAAASHSAAEKPQNTPSAWSLRWRERSLKLSVMRELKLLRLLATPSDQTNRNIPPARTTRGTRKFAWRSIVPPRLPPCSAFEQMYWELLCGIINRAALI